MTGDESPSPNVMPELLWSNKTEERIQKTSQSKRRRISYDRTGLVNWSRTMRYWSNVLFIDSVVRLILDA